MQEASWNGLFDTRWADAPLGREAIRLVQWLRERGYSDRSHREYAHAVVHLGRVLHEAQGEVTPRALDETVDMAMKRAAIARCTPPVPEPTGESPWRSRQDIIQWLEDL